MARGSLVHISLAAKCRLLFGLAVVLIMAAALFWPFDRMEKLVDAMNVRRARQMALAVRARPEVTSETDADARREQIQAWWTTYADQRELPSQPPTVESLSCADVASDALPETFDAFRREAVRQMCAETATDPNLLVDEHHVAQTGPDGHPRLRYVLGVRATEDDDTARDVLLGVIFVELPTMNEPLWNRIVIIAAGAGAGLLALLVFYLITERLILSPVHELRDVADQVSGGDLDVRATVATGDEFERLADAFNRMLDNLRAAREKLRKTNQSLDIKLGELAEANVALFEADKLKSEFVTSVTHELRTPLSSIIGFAELLNEAYDPDVVPPADEASRVRPRLARYASNILTSGRMLLDIINDLLDLSKIEAGQMEVHRGPVILRDICESLVDATRPLSAQKSLAVALAVDDALPTLDSDAGKIQQILYNLLSNAIKFTPDGGRIDIAARCEDATHVRLAVSDTGPGIPTDQQEMIFDKFRQADGTVTRDHGGTGLGLPISRELARMLGGSITVASTPGRGATFAVVLPVVAPKTVETRRIPLTPPSLPLGGRQ